MKKRSRFRLARPLALFLALAAVCLVVPRAGRAAPPIGVAAATDAGDWAPPMNVTDWFLFTEWAAQLEMGADGTQAVYWVEVSSLYPIQAALRARVRSAAGTWSAVEDVSPPVSGPAIGFFNPSYTGTGVGNDGTAWMVRTISDTVRSKMQVVVDRRPPGGSWQSGPLSGWVGAVRSADLHVGPDGDLAAAWVECDTFGGSDRANGTCAVQVRRRPAGAPAWEAATRVDQAPAGIRRAYVIVGPGGLTVALWNEALQMSDWTVMARAYEPATGAWEGSPSSISNGWVEPRKADENWLVRPVMSQDGTVVAAWQGRMSPGSSQGAQFSNTRAAASGTWSPIPAQISSPRDISLLDLPHLALHGGTTVAAWTYQHPTTSQQAVFANVRDPGSAWAGAESRVSDWMSTLDFRDLGVWPDGTAVLLWGVEDAGRVTTADEALFWSARHTATWGDGGEGQLGGWMDEIDGAALELGDDGAGTVLWTVSDAAEPAGHQGRVLASHWPPGGPWDAPLVLAEGHRYAGIWPDGTAVGAGGQPVAAIWIARRDVSSSTPSLAFFHSQRPLHQIYLPLVTKAG